ncbi:MAG: DNA polymerase I [Phycisphaerae bacterium]|nr:DNA polymerase I [Phycisphaerae bacterium]
MAKRFFLIDGLSQIFRCYYAPFQNLSTPAGEPIKATYVFSNMLLQLVREQKPDYLAMVMEGGDEKAVFRKELDPQYKANREPPPEDLAPQIERILQIIRSQGIPVLSVPGFEADDLLATLATRLAGEDLEIVMVSRDKDLDQLVTGQVRLYDPMKNEFIGPREIEAQKGYRPEQAIEIQTLVGDSTDNIQGVRGIGPKKAAALIAKYGTAKAVVDHADELTPAMRKNVLDFADRLEQTRQLVTLRRDVPLDLDLESCRFQGIRPAVLKAIFAELGFRRLTDLMGAEPGPPEPPRAPAVQHAGSHSRPAAHAQLSLFGGDESAPILPPAQPQPSPPRARQDDRNYRLIDGQDRFRDFLARLKAQPVFAIDTETTSLSPVDAELAGLSFSWQADTGYYLPLRGVGQCLPIGPTLEALRPILADPNVKKIGQNIKYDLVVLKHHGIEVAGVAFDTMIASFVLDSTRRSHGMDALARELLGFDPIPISDLIGKGSKQIRFDQVDTARACEYSAEDADVTWQLYEVLSKQLAGSPFEPLFRDTEMPLVAVLADMEAEGIRLDASILEQMSRDLSNRLEELKRQIYEQVGHPFNVDSPKQLATVLFDELKLPVVRNTKTGRSTDAETLEALAWQHPVAQLIKEYRELGKLKNTYVDTLPEMVSRRTGRIHASFNQTAAITGRLSSSDPNLQNIPIRTEIGQQIRKAFVPSDADHVLLTADYSQIELRVLAHFCGDQALQTAFVEDRDIHQFVAAQVFGVPLDQVTKQQRGRAKAVNFGIIYGQGAYGLSRTTGTSVTEAQSFINMYFMRYPGIRMFIDKTVAEARKRGYVETILGRRRQVPEINSQNKGMRSLGERMAVNTVIQGSAADLIKRAMISIHRRIGAEPRPSRMLIQVHDELVFDVPRSAVEAEAEFIRTEMCTALPLKVPIKVDINWGENWLEGK